MHLDQHLIRIGKRDYSSTRSFAVLLIIDRPRFEALYKYSSFTVTTDYIASTQISMMIFYSSMSYEYLEEYIPYTWKDVLGKN